MANVWYVYHLLTASYSISWKSYPLSRHRFILYNLTWSWSSCSIDDHYVIKCFCCCTFHAICVLSAAVIRTTD